MTTVKKALTKYFTYPEHRDAIYDYIRVIACIGVVGIHVMPVRFTALGSFFFCVFWPALPMFFVMSGALLLGGKEKPSDEYLGAFYLRRFEAVVLPFLLYACFWGCWIDTWHTIPQIPTAEDLSTSFAILPTVLYENLTSLRTPHFWFIYELIGLYLITPFLKKGLHACSFNLLKKMFLVILIVMSIAVYLPLAGIKLYFTNYFAAWISCYILGYILTREEMDRYYPILVIAGGIAFLFLMFWCYFMPDKVSTDFYHMAPHMILMVSGLFSLCMLFKKQLTASKKLNWVMMRLGKYSFCVYAIHYAFLFQYSATYPDYGETTVGIILVLLAVYGKSILFAVVFDNLITFNLQRLFRWAVGGIQKLFSKTVSGGSR